MYLLNIETISMATLDKMLRISNIEIYHLTFWMVLGVASMIYCYGV